MTVDDFAEFVRRTTDALYGPVTPEGVDPAVYTQHPSYVAQNANQGPLSEGLRPSGRIDPPTADDPSVTELRAYLEANGARLEYDTAPLLRDHSHNLAQTTRLFCSHDATQSDESAKSPRAGDRLRKLVRRMLGR